jgi:hypothetical protein
VEKASPATVAAAIAGTPTADATMSVTSPRAASIAGSGFATMASRMAAVRSAATATAPVSQAVAPRRFPTGPDVSDNCGVGT